MSDALSVLLIDSNGDSASSSVFVSDDAPESQVLEFGALVAACSPATAETASRLTSWALSQTPGSSGYAIGVAALLNFLADGVTVPVIVPAPSSACFLGDGTVDETYAPIADLIAWILANGESAFGVGIDSYDSGERITLASGINAVYGAASRVKASNGLDVSFHSIPDGGDATSEP